MCSRDNTINNIVSKFFSVLTPKILILENASEIGHWIHFQTVKNLEVINFDTFVSKPHYVNGSSVSVTVERVSDRSVPVFNIPRLRWLSTPVKSEITEEDRHPFLLV
jgi:hypothetical protein